MDFQNMDETTMQRILAEIQSSEKNPDLPGEELSAIYWKMHALAEARYEPAKAFFISCLYNLNRVWREHGIRALQHYPLRDDGDDDEYEQIRVMLWSDPDPQVRITAAGILGSQRNQGWPDWALAASIRDDPAVGVRNTAFVSLLRTAGVGDSVAYKIGEEFRKSKLPVTWEALEQRLVELGIDPSSLLQGP